MKQTANGLVSLIRFERNRLDAAVQLPIFNLLTRSIKKKGSI